MTEEEELIYTRGIMQGISDVRDRYITYLPDGTELIGNDGLPDYKTIYGRFLEDITADLYKGANVRKQQLIYEIKEEIARADTKPSKYKSFNINDKIRFRINPKYTKRICNYWSDKYDSKETLESLFGIADQDGFRPYKRLQQAA